MHGVITAQSMSREDCDHHKYDLPIIANARLSGFELEGKMLKVM